MAVRPYLMLAAECLSQEAERGALSFCFAKRAIISIRVIDRE